jgi:hypothetical protein
VKHETFWKGVKPGDIVRRGSWGSGEPREAREPKYGRVLAIAPVAGRDWPDVLVILPGGDVQTWHRWGKVGAEEAGELAWMWKRTARQ